MSTETAPVRDGWLARPGGRGAVATVLAVAVNVAIVLVADAVGIAPGFEHLSARRVALLSAAGAVGATTVYLVLARAVATPDRTFRLVAGIVLVLSFLPDLALLSAEEAATVPGVLVLMLMHVVVAVLAVGLLTGWNR
jgi:hypothetical protein